MMSYLKLIKNQRGVALFIVLTAMATLAIFVGEITYTAQVNQKLAYDRLDQIKAHALAKSGLRLALLRIRAYTELRKTVSSLAKSAGASASAANAVVPKAIMEKIWNEPITVPFSGDISGLPMAARDAITKFRKDSSMEGKLYISIQAQSSKFNLNSTIASFAPSPTPSASPNASATATPVAGASPSATPPGFDQDKARELMTEQIKNTLQKKFEDDEKFRDRYRNLKPEDIADEILGWSDLTFQSQAAQRANVPFKQAPFYDISELHYLPSIDDQLYDLLSNEYTAGVNSSINVNMIKDRVLAALVPQMTEDERKKFFEYRDNTGSSSSDAKSSSGQAGNPAKDPNEDHSFKEPDEFFKYLKEKVAAFGGSDSKINDYKTALANRGITITTEENNFIVRIEATVQQTKRILEAWVTLVEDSSTSTTKNKTGAGATSTSGTNPNTTTPTTPVNGAAPASGRSNLKITQLRFL